MSPDMSPDIPEESPRSAAPIRLRLRLHFGDLLMLGPGKADLLEGIRDTGSIAAAGRGMSMSYKRAWSLVEDMNTAFRAPLVHSSRGGAHGGGASLTEMGEVVLAHYRRLEEITLQAGQDDIAAIEALLAP
ncbi:LysR family transcriptional regulator [Celeribacter sp. HF31]|nr:LysR family transcriptional regulator [Celeribacter sp. HF31]